MEIISHRRAYAPSVSLKQACCRRDVLYSRDVFFMQKFHVKSNKILRCSSIECFQPILICRTLIVPACQNIKAMVHYFVCRSSSLILSKSEAPCRYFTMPGGCVRGEKCLFSHPTAEIMPMEMGQSFMPKLQVGGTKVSIPWVRDFVTRMIETA